MVDRWRVEKVEREGRTGLTMCSESISYTQTLISC